MSGPKGSPRLIEAACRARLRHVRLPSRTDRVHGPAPRRPDGDQVRDRPRRARRHRRVLRYRARGCRTICDWRRSGRRKLHAPKVVAREAWPEDTARPPDRQGRPGSGIPLRAPSRTASPPSLPPRRHRRHRRPDRRIAALEKGRCESQIPLCLNRDADRIAEVSKRSRTADTSESGPRAIVADR